MQAIYDVFHAGSSRLFGLSRAETRPSILFDTSTEVPQLRPVTGRDQNMLLPPKSRSRKRKSAEVSKEDAAATFEDGLSLLDRIRTLDASKHAKDYVPFIVMTKCGRVTKETWPLMHKCVGQVLRRHAEMLRDDCPFDSNELPCFGTCADMKEIPNPREGSPRYEFPTIRLDLFYRDTPDDRSVSMDTATQLLIDKGIIPRRHGDLYPVSVGGPGDEALCVIDRNAAPFFGITSVGVHLNCFVKTPGKRGASGISVWMAQRSPDKSSFPSRWDPTVAGGHPAGISLMNNLVKEAGEEAGISPDLVRNAATAVGCLSEMTSKPDGTCMKHSLYYSWDLEVGEEFRPRATDGEVAKFELWSAEELEEEVRRGNRLRPAMILVVTDFLIRHGIITPDKERDYARIQAAMHQDRLVLSAKGVADD